jgi:hypothetical protein
LKPAVERVPDPRTGIGCRVPLATPANIQDKPACGKIIHHDSLFFDPEDPFLVVHRFISF